MKLTSILITAALVMSFFSSGLHSAPVETSGKITNIMVYGSGMVVVDGLDFPPNNCAGYQDSFRIDENHPNLDRFLSLLLSAQAANRTIAVKADVATSCYAPTILPDNGSFIIVQ